MVLIELLEGAISMVPGVDPWLAAGLATIGAVVYYSREIATWIATAARTVSLAVIVAGTIGIGLLVLVATGSLSIDDGLLGGLLRFVGRITHGGI